MDGLEQVILGIDYVDSPLRDEQAYRPIGAAIELHLGALDADAAGTLIYQALQEGTRARPGRRVQIINLGLEPWEAIDLNLQVETAKYEKRQPAAGRCGSDDKLAA